MARKNLTEPADYEGVLAQRRAVGGARRQISATLVLHCDDRRIDAWALNISRGGIRVVAEEPVELGQVVGVEGYDPDDPGAPVREARVVWVQQEEDDGAIMGMQFLDVDLASSGPVSVPGVAPSTSMDDSSSTGDDE